MTNMSGDGQAGELSSSPVGSYMTWGSALKYAPEYPLPNSHHLILKPLEQTPWRKMVPIFPTAVLSSVGTTSSWTSETIVLNDPAVSMG